MAYKEEMGFSKQQVEVLNYIETIIGLQAERMAQPLFTSKDSVVHALCTSYNNALCWHFASILKETFHRGEICLAAPFSHIIFKDTDGTVYDSFGIYEGEAYYAIPIYKYLSLDDIAMFMHTSTDQSTLNKQYCIDIMKKYCEDNKIAYDPSCEKYLRE